MTKTIRLNPNLETKLRLAVARSGQNEATFLRFGVEKACDEILAAPPPLEGEALKAFAESLIAKVEAAENTSTRQCQKSQDSEITRLMDAKERANRRKIGASTNQKAAA